MRVDLQDLIDSARLCGRSPYIFGDVVFIPLVVEGEEAALDWNPPTNPTQDREIRNALLAKGWSVVYHPKCCELVKYKPMESHFNFICDPEDFLTLAGAHVWREAKEGE